MVEGLFLCLDCCFVCFWVCLWWEVGFVFFWVYFWLFGVDKFISGVFLGQACEYGLEKYLTDFRTVSPDTKTA